MRYVKAVPRLLLASSLLGPMLGLSGCTLLPGSTDRAAGNRAFIEYWPPAKGDTRLKLAVKDNIDVKGIVTTAGSEYIAKQNQPAKADAACLAIARQRNVVFVGKANMSELAVAPSGINEYYGTPENPYDGWLRRIPGGSSSGAAVAVASGMADVAFGTDTAGSVRVPAACCGVVGLKTTKGLVPITGVYPIEPKHLDTVGPLAKDIAHTVQGMDLLQRGFAGQYEAAKSAKPTGQSIRVGRLRLRGTDPKIDQAIDTALTKAGFQVVPLGEDFVKQWEQAKKDGNTVAAAGAWISDSKYALALGVSGRTKSALLVGRLAYPGSYEEALDRRHAWKTALRKTFEKVDFIAVPTIQSMPPLIPPNLKIGIIEVRMLDLQNTVAVNFAGNPALAVPVPLRQSSIPVTSLQLIGPRLSEAGLLNAGRIVEEAVKKPRH
jgi:Asp-tRNA(Asn)/Glu-tRNA(Gln) amidotransferase A subunit family amidase